MLATLYRAEAVHRGPAAPPSILVYRRNLKSASTHRDLRMLLKVKIHFSAPQVYANSARALRDLLARYRNLHLLRPTIKTQKFVC